MLNLNFKKGLHSKNWRSLYFFNVVILKWMILCFSYEQLEPFYLNVKFLLNTVCEWSTPITSSFLLKFAVLGSQPNKEKKRLSAPHSFLTYFELFTSYRGIRNERWEVSKILLPNDLSLSIDWSTVMQSSWALTHNKKQQQHLYWDGTLCIPILLWLPD